jgi:hypothetical protein
LFIGSEVCSDALKSPQVGSKSGSKKRARASTEADAVAPAWHCLSRATLARCSRPRSCTCRLHLPHWCPLLSGDIGSSLPPARLVLAFHLLAQESELCFSHLLLFEDSSFSVSALAAVCPHAIGERGGRDDERAECDPIGGLPRLWAGDSPGSFHRTPHVHRSQRQFPCRRRPTPRALAYTPASRSAAPSEALARSVAHQAFKGAASKGRRVEPDDRVYASVCVRVDERHSQADRAVALGFLVRCSAARSGCSPSGQ